MTVKDLLTRLCTYHSPDEAAKIFFPVWDSIPSDELFNRSNHEYKQLQEVWMAVSFAKLLGILGVKGEFAVEQEMNSDADFYFRYDGSEYRFQCTEAMDPSRKRGKEFAERKMAAGTPLVSPYRPSRGTQEGPVWIANTIIKKEQKSYSTKPNLLVYVNFDHQGIDLQQVNKLVCSSRSSFSSCWLMRGGIDLIYENSFEVKRCVTLLWPHPMFNLKSLAWLPE